MRFPLFRAPKKPEAAPASFDPARYEPALRKSICTGEGVAGFVEKATGRFTEVALIADQKDLDAFQRKYGVAGQIKTIY